MAPAAPAPAGGPGPDAQPRPGRSVSSPSERCAGEPAKPPAEGPAGPGAAGVAAAGAASPGASPGPAPEREAQRIRVDSAAGLLAVIPHLIGFRPDRSMVILGIAPPRERIRLGFRYDLPDPPDAETAAHIAGHAVGVLARQQLSMAVLAGFGPGQLVTPVIDALRAATAAAGIGLREVLRADEGRYWSYLCHDPACCPVEGKPYDTLAHPAATALAAAGLAAYPDRDALAATLAPVTGLAAESMRQATDRALDRVSELIMARQASGRAGDLLSSVVDAGLGAVQSAIAAYRGGGQLTSHDDLAFLSMALSDLRIRDDAWARMDPEHSAAHQRLWTDLTRRACPQYRPAPASLLAFTAWQAGDGALAGLAAQCALDADPQYSMALMLADFLGRGLPPSLARLPMTPEQVAESYAQPGIRRRHSRRSPSRGRPR